MLIALVIVALLAVGLAAMLLVVRSSASEFRALAEARESALVGERDELTEANVRAGRELEAAEAKAERLTEEGAKQSAEIRRLGGEIEKAQSVAAQQSMRIDQQGNEITALVTDNSGLQKQLDGAEAARREAEAATIAAEGRIAELEANATRVALGRAISGDGPPADALWDLEVVRSERTWRNSVAVDPSVPSGPFETTDDPVRLAVEIEAAALRENVGASITIDWRAPAVAEPARRHLVVRVAQEMLEAAARSSEATRLVVTGDDADGELVLELVSAEDDDEVISLITPRVATELVDVKESAGLSVTVKADG